MDLTDVITDNDIEIMDKIHAIVDPINNERRAGRIAEAGVERDKRRDPEVSVQNSGAKGY